MKNPVSQTCSKRKLKSRKVNYNANKIIIFKANKCPLCKCKDIFRDEDNFYSRICFDLRFLTYGIKRWITIYRTPFHFCYNCNTSFIPKNFMRLSLYARRSDTPKKYIKQKGFGHNILAWTVHQNVVNGVTFRNLENNAKDYFGLQIDNRRMWDLKNFAAEFYKMTYNKILKKIVKGYLVHADETKINLKKDNGYVWVFTTMEEVLFMYKPTRESGFLHELLKEFKGVLVTDFYSGYDSLECPQQKCLVHLIRDLNDALLKNPFDDELKEVVVMFGSLLRKIIVTIDRFGLKSRFMKKHRNDVNNFFKKLLNDTYLSELAESFRKRMIKYEKELFLFLTYDNVPWNNNNAEHTIKNFAKYRALVNGRITERGLEAHLILLSIYQTCNYKGINFLDFLLSKERDIDKYILKNKIR